MAEGDDRTPCHQENARQPTPVGTSRFPRGFVALWRNGWAGPVRRLLPRDFAIRPDVEHDEPITVVPVLFEARTRGVRADARGAVIAGSATDRRTPNEGVTAGACGRRGQREKEKRGFLVESARSMRATAIHRTEGDERSSESPIG